MDAKALKRVEKAIANQGLSSSLTPEQIVNLLNFLLMGYFVVKSSTEGYSFWDEEHDFLDSIVKLFLQGSLSQGESALAASESSIVKFEPQQIEDLPASLVRCFWQVSPPLLIR